MRGIQQLGCNTKFTIFTSWRKKIVVIIEMNLVISILLLLRKKKKKRRHFLTFSPCLNGINVPFTASEGTKETTTHCYKLWKLSNTKILNHISSCNPKPSPKKGKRKNGKANKNKGQQSKLQFQKKIKTWTWEWVPIPISKKPELQGVELPCGSTK